MQGLLQHARALINNEILGYSQWFPGNKNDVGDSLLQDHHLTDAHLVSLLSSTVPNQLPENF